MRLVGVLVSTLVLVACMRDAGAIGVASFVDAKVLVMPTPGHPGTDWLPLALDLSAPGGGITHLSIPPGADAHFEITVIASGGPIHLALLDGDDQDDDRGWPDELDEQFRALGVMPGDTVRIRLRCDCASSYVEGFESSGEQSAEVYVKDGNKRLPAPPAGGGPKDGWWQIDCDKTFTRHVIAPDTVKTPWLDTLIVPMGALPAPTEVRISNMYPLRDLEAVPEGYLPISEALTIEPLGLDLQVPATLVFRYTQEEVGDLADEQTLSVFRYDSTTAQWIPIGGQSIEPVGNTLRVPVHEFGTYGFAARVPQLITWDVQHSATSFGNNGVGQVGRANGSELDDVKALMQEGKLYLYFGGNLETNFNKLELFFDGIPGGQNRLRGDNPDIDFGGLLRMGDDGSGNGFTFEPGFEADHWIGLTVGLAEVGGQNDADSVYKMYVNYATLPSTGGGVAHYLGETRAGDVGLLEGGDNPFGLRARIDNSNVAGVFGGCGGGFPGEVPTGIELAIPLGALGVTDGCIGVTAFVNGVDHDFVSNQFLGSLAPGACSLGEPRLVDLGAQAWDQVFAICGFFVTAAPEPMRNPQTGLEAWPNPFREELQLRLFGVEGRSVLAAEIFDVAGRRVRDLGGDAFRSGTARWDGRTDAGRKAPAGIYLVRVKGTGFTRSQRVLRVR